MEGPKPLNFETKTLIQTLKDRLDALAKKRTDREEKAKAKAVAAKDAIVALLNEHAELVVLVNSFLRNEFGYSATSPRLAVEIKEAYRDEEEDFVDLGDEIILPYDEQALERLIKVYELTSDQSVELQVHDEAYRYLA